MRTGRVRGRLGMGWGRGDLGRWAMWEGRVVGGKPFQPINLKYLVRNEWEWRRTTARRLRSSQRWKEGRVDRVGAGERGRKGQRELVG